MFTGIIRNLGEVLSSAQKNDDATFVIIVENNFIDKVRIGDSISVNGACMTVESKTKDTFNFTAVSESLKKSNLGILKTGDSINLESSMTLASVVDGHLVSGHVDCTGIISEIGFNGTSHEFFVRFPAEFSKYVIYKGSVCLNGISLTVAEITDEGESDTEIKIAVIPHTYENTNLKYARQKDYVNLEFDIIGKYISRMIPAK
ncbi:riboflavin synthase [soil metagenome]